MTKERAIAILALANIAWLAILIASHFWGASPPPAGATPPQAPLVASQAIVRTLPAQAPAVCPCPNGGDCTCTVAGGKCQCGAGCTCKKCPGKVDVEAPVSYKKVLPSCGKAGCTCGVNCVCNEAVNCGCYAAEKKAMTDPPTGLWEEWNNGWFKSRTDGSWKHSVLGSRPADYDWTQPAAQQYVVPQQLPTPILQVPAFGFGGGGMRGGCSGGG